jgi:hypothetical protein
VVYIGAIDLKNQKKTLKRPKRLKLNVSSIKIKKEGRADTAWPFFSLATGNPDKHRHKSLKKVPGILKGTNARIERHIYFKFCYEVPRTW